MELPSFAPSSGDGSGGESAAANVMEELKDWSTSAGKSTSVWVGEGAGDTLGDRDGEWSWLIVNDSTSGEDEKAAILSVQRVDSCWVVFRKTQGPAQSG